MALYLIGRKISISFKKQSDHKHLKDTANKKGIKYTCESKSVPCAMKKEYVYKSEYNNDNMRHLKNTVYITDVTLVKKWRTLPTA
jgi:hypothetical protein